MAIYLFGREAAFEQGEDLSDDDDTDKLDIPIHAFDIVIADECHRGYTAAEQSVWRKTLDHFDAVKVGLTATPAAHTKAYFNDVVYRYADVISMVKHAANDAEPLLTAAERVQRAIAKAEHGRTFTPDQRRWLDRIASHLTENLSVDRDDFDLIPTLSHEGGWGAANKAFAGRLPEVLATLNEAVAA